MEIPFTLQLLQELFEYQTIRKLDKQFKNHLDTLSATNTTLPLWEVEKKILLWTYTHHKHLGSPLLSEHFDLIQNYCDKNILKGNQFNNKSTNEIENILLETAKKFPKSVPKWNSEGDKRREEAGLSVNELSKIKIKKVFSNLVTRGYANYSSNNDDSCSIQITSKGLLFGSLIYKLYIIDKTSLKNKYSTKSGAKYVLKKRKIWNTIFMTLYIVGWLALILICLYIIKEFINVACLILKKVHNIYQSITSHLNKIN